MDDDEEVEQTQVTEESPEKKPRQAAVSWDDNTQVLDISPPRGVARVQRRRKVARDRKTTNHKTWRRSLIGDEQNERSGAERRRENQKRRKTADRHKRTI